MTNSLSVRVVSVVFAVSAISMLHAEDGKLPLHNWKRIVYPYSPQDSSEYSTSMSITPDAVRGLCFHLSFDYALDKKPKLPTDPVMRLHLSNGKFIDGKALGGEGFTQGGGTDVSYACFFPWQPNVLDEAWLEVHLIERVCWLEIPYGYTRNPSDPLKPTEVRTGKPKLAPAMKDMGAKDVILGWKYVEYDIGEIQNGWRLSARLSNSRDVRAELELYKEHGNWELYSPRTAISVLDKGEVLPYRCITLHLHEHDNMRRSDTHAFSVLPYASREMLSYTITVEDKAYTFNAPSSMLHDRHGTADLNNKARIQEKPQW